MVEPRTPIAALLVLVHAYRNFTLTGCRQQQRLTQAADEDTVVLRG